MTANRSNLLGCPTVAAALLFATSAFAADPFHGETLVKRWCSSCHLVGPDQQGSTSEATPFVAIAKGLYLMHQNWLSSSSIRTPKMPNMQLSRTEAADIAAYIDNLK